MVQLDAEALRRLGRPDIYSREPIVARKINREVVLLLGWGPAILMQLANPLVAAGVAEHSSFRAHPRERLRRFRSTVSAMLALTFGTPEEVLRAARGINIIHDRVHGTLPEDATRFPRGSAYSAHDPDLLSWVHATMLHMLPATYEMFVGPLSSDEKDRYCEEASGVAPLLGIPDGYLPTNVAQLENYMRAMLASGELVITDVARELAAEIVSPKLPPGSRPLVWLMQLATIGLLPSVIRDAYGFGWSQGSKRALRSCALIVRALLKLSPPLVRHWPAARRVPA